MSRRLNLSPWEDGQNYWTLSLCGIARSSREFTAWDHLHQALQCRLVDEPTSRTMDCRLELHFSTKDVDDVTEISQQTAHSSFTYATSEHLVESGVWLGHQREDYIHLRCRPCPGVGSLLWFRSCLPDLRGISAAVKLDVQKSGGQRGISGGSPNGNPPIDKR